MIQINPIGVVHVNHTDNFVRRSIEGVQGTIEIFPDYEEGLKKIEGFSHLIIISFLHKVGEERRKVLKVRPRGLLKFGIDIKDLPEVGVFCTDSPHRPNPIGLSIVRLLKVKGRFLEVDNLDLFNQTPILDIKPYTPSRRVELLFTPTWYSNLIKMVRDKVGPVREI